MIQCRHCGLQFSRKKNDDYFCCSGCHFAHDFLENANLTRFYDLRNGAGLAVGENPYLSAELFDWAPALIQKKSDFYSLSLDIQGLHCAACIWLIEQVFQKEPHAVRIRVNSSLGQTNLIFKNDFPVRDFLLKLAHLGYLTAPQGQQKPTESNQLLFRFAICSALAMNSMVISAAFYLGLTRAESPLIYAAFSWTNLFLSALCLWVGGSVFFKSAYWALKQRVIHLDLPIALGLALGFLGSLISFFSNTQNAIYFDTLNIFVSLMLLGRILQSRIIHHNRSLLLSDNSISNLNIRRVKNTGIELVAAQKITQDTEILVVPGEVLPCQSELLELQATCSLEWIQGESEAHIYKQHESIPAGAFNIGKQAIRLKTQEDFASSHLVRLLAAPSEENEKNQVTSQLLPILSRYYALGVLFIASIAFAVWFPVGFEQALSVTVALLVVTCPCAIGLATPLALDLAIVRLRRSGIYIRNTDFLSRLLQVRKFFFDKTGTLTLGELELLNPDALKKLDTTEKNALFQMVSRSNHPKCKAILRYLQGKLDPNAIVTETRGVGMSWESWEFSGALKKNGQTQAIFEFAEELKEDVTQQLYMLKKMGIDFYLLSGDQPSKVLELAKRLSIPKEYAWGGLSPEQKAEKIIKLDHQDSLMIGDGINDALAFDAAYCA
ncbi:MAG: HAD family hydrolase, partial [Myxococcaceae bacterium]